MKPEVNQEPVAAVAKYADRLLEQVAQVFIGNRELSEHLLIALLAKGHVLLEGVPGVAKTTLAKTFATTLGCEYKRIQFTPDMLPADITGTYVFTPNDGTFRLREGPVFANIVLGDEINRAPAKTQSALLEAMQESQVTIDGVTRTLPQPFIVIATQNPVEQAGTYPLPEAQIDRFMMRLIIGYPTPSTERMILRKFTSETPQPTKVLDPETILAIQQMVSRVHVENEVLDYVVRISTFTRQHARVFLGASPRASLTLVYACQARSLIHKREFVIPDDVKHLAVPVLAHRLILTPEAQMDGLQGDAIIRQALEQVPHRHGSTAWG
jgi:MoxR-like ATPase